MEESTTFDKVVSTAKTLAKETVKCAFAGVVGAAATLTTLVVVARVTRR